MQVQDDRLTLSATDLANHLGCQHLTHLAHRHVRGLVERPAFVDPALAVLEERGQQHEAAYLAHLEGQGYTIARVQSESDAVGSYSTTGDAMRGGADVIFQAPLGDGVWHGRADFLIRVDRPSDLGSYSYEVHDTKLGSQARAGTILQLSLYSDLVSRIQGVLPEHMVVIKPGDGFEPEPFRTDDFAAYYRLIRRDMEETVARDRLEADPETYPEPVAQCDICRWRPSCNKRRREDDHLSLVAGMQTGHRREFTEQGVTKLEQLGESENALSQPPKRGHASTFEKLREQASVQLRGRKAKRNVHELLHLEEHSGLFLLPEPTPGDVFFDIEGDAFFGDGGLEYLLGFSFASEADGPLESRSLWALDVAQERRSLDGFVDWIMERWAEHPAMHIYHFAPYEPSAMKRLMSRHGSRGGGGGSPVPRRSIHRPS